MQVVFCGDFFQLPPVDNPREWVCPGCGKLGNGSSVAVGLLISDLSIKFQCPSLTRINHNHSN